MMTTLDSDDVSDNIENTKTDDAGDVPSQAIFLFTRKEELCIRPSSSDNKIFPIDAYSQFITDEVVDEIVKETNRYTSQVVSSSRLT